MTWSVGLDGPGTIVAGTYRLDRLVGQGSIACVYSATHTTRGERVALKFLKPQCMENAELVSRFAQEGRSVSRIHSPHVAKVFDFGSHEGVPFIAMELLEGKDLRAVMKERGPLPVGELATILAQACAALDAAHAQGIVHRDIKPDNLFLVGKPGGPSTLKVLDFGISKVAEHLRDTGAKFRTGDMQMVGSPHYMSPEQIKTPREIDGRSDLWSLGVVAYELWTGGERPFVGPNLAMLVMAILCNPPRAPWQQAAHNETFLAVIHACLQKDVDLRIQSAAELAKALARFVPSKAEEERAEAVRARLRAHRAAEAPAMTVEEKAELPTMPVPASGDTFSAVTEKRKFGT